jgi:hypothetical protein
MITIFIPPEGGGGEATPLLMPPEGYTHPVAHTQDIQRLGVLLDVRPYDVQKLLAVVSGFGAQLTLRRPRQHTAKILSPNKSSRNVRILPVLCTGAVSSVSFDVGRARASPEMWRTRLTAPIIPIRRYLFMTSRRHAQF